MQHPALLWLIIPAIIGLLFMLRLDLVKFHDKKEQKQYDKHKRKRRLIATVFTIVIICLIAIAASSPFTTTLTKEKGNPQLVILSDNSSSMNLFESGLSNVLGSKLEGEFPVTVRQIGVGDRSALGDGILNNMQGDDSLLLVSDGQSTHGRDFGDILRLAYDLNTTISAMNLVAQKSDASIQILGPDKQIEQLDTEFLVAVNKVGDPSCSITIKSDGNIVVQTSKLEDFTFNRRFGQGDHKLHAQMACQNDHFSANNQYFKTIQIVPKPKILYLAKEASPLDTSFTRYYRYERTPTMPSSLSSYQAVVINDFSAQELLPHTPLLQDYVAEGNGLVVVGGKNAYDQGGYKNSLLEAMLPVQVGTSDKSEEGSLNIIIVIDISGSTGSGFSSGGDSSKVDVEKSLAIDILKDIRVNDKVGVVAFNRQAYDVSPLTSLSEKRDITTKIARLQDSGGTEIFKGLRRASQMLAFVEGGKNIVIISDGETQFWSYCIIICRCFSYRRN